MNNTLDLNRKVPLRVKIGFPLTGVGGNAQMILQMYFLLTFYVSFLGISGTAAALIIMIARIWDFINDPITGVLVEKVRRPEKCIFLMRCACIPAGIFMVLCYCAPQFSYGMKIVWAFVTFVCMGMSQTVYNISSGTMQPSLTTDREERAKMNVYSQVVSTILNALIPAVTMPLVGWLSGFGEATAFAKLAAIYAVLYIAFGFLGTHMLRGYDASNEISMENAGKGQSVKASDMFKALAVNKPALLILTSQVIKMLFSSIAGSVMYYFCIYNLGSMTAMSLSSSLSTIGGVIPIIFLVPFYRKFGNAGSGLIGCIIALATYFVMFITGVPSVAFYVGASIIGTIGTTLLSAVMGQNLMDCVDYGEWKTGSRNTGVIMSAYGIGTKIGLAFGSSIAGFVIGALHFDPNAAEQPANVLSAFFHINITLQLVVYVALLLIMLYLRKIEKRLPEMRAEIAARKAEAAQAASENTETATA